MVFFNNKLLKIISIKCLTPQSQAAAVGADVPDPHAFGNDNIQIDTSTPTCKANRFDNKNAKVTQSKSV